LKSTEFGKTLLETI